MNASERLPFSIPAIKMPEDIGIWEYAFLNKDASGVPLSRQAKGWQTWYDYHRSQKV